MKITQIFGKVSYLKNLRNYRLKVDFFAISDFVINIFFEKNVNLCKNKHYETNAVL